MPRVPSKPLLEEYPDLDLQYGIVIENMTVTKRKLQNPFFIKDRKGVCKVPYDISILNKNWDISYQNYFNTHRRISHGSLVVFVTFPRDKVTAFEAVCYNRVMANDEIELDICVDMANNRVYTHCFGIMTDYSLPKWPHVLCKGYFRYTRMNGDFVFELVAVKHTFKECTICEMDKNHNHNKSKCFYCNLRQDYTRDDKTFTCGYQAPSAYYPVSRILKKTEKL